MKNKITLYILESKGEWEIAIYHVFQICESETQSMGYYASTWDFVRARTGTYVFERSKPRALVDLREIYNRLIYKNPCCRRIL